MKLYSKVIFLTCLTIMVFCFSEFLAQPVLAGETVLPRTAMDSKLKATLTSLQVPFVQNEGQIRDEQVKFYAQTFAGNVFVTDEGITYALKGEEGQSWAVSEAFVGSSRIVPVGEKTSATKVNSFIGSDHSQWKSGLPTFDEVALGEIYDRISVNLRAYGNNMEKIFTVAPGGDPASILLEVTGADGLTINAQGELEIATGMGMVKMTAPVAYQELNGERVNVAVAYELKGEGYGFAVGDYDRAYTLVIDPLLAATFLGGTGSNTLSDMVIDSSGNIFVGGITNALDFPLVDGAIDSTGDSSNNDVFISKLKSNLTGPLLASTYLGGSSTEFDGSLALAVDSIGNLYVTGSTISNDFPGIKSGAYQSSITTGDCPDIFVSKLNSDLSDILASTYLGGGKDDTPTDLTLDSSGHVFVAGNTGSANFPTSTGALDTVFGTALAEGFVSRFNPDLSASDFRSTLVGGKESDYVNCIYIDPTDPSGNVFIGGTTKYSSTLKTALPPLGFPRTAGAFRTAWTSTSGTFSEGFVAKLNNELSGSGGYPLASTFLGRGVSPFAMCLDNTSEKNLYITGSTGMYLKTTAGVYDRSFSAGIDVFIMKLTNGLAGNGLGSEKDTEPLAATFLGDSGQDRGRSIAIDSLGNVIVAGDTLSTNYPITEGAFDSLFDIEEGFITKLKADLTGPLLVSTFLGGSGASGDWPKAMSLDSAGNVYVAGNTSSTDFPVTSGAFDETLAANSSKGFVAKLSSDLLLQAPQVPLWTGTLTATNIGPTGLTLNWSGASDNNGITGYKIYQGGVEITTLPGTASSYSITGLTADTEYTFKVEAGNTLGKWSTDGPTLTKRTIVADSEVPTWPAGSTLRVEP